MAEGADPVPDPVALSRYLTCVEQDLPELWPGATRWTDSWGSCGSYPDGRGYGGGVDRVRVPPERLPEFWKRLAETYPEPPAITVGPRETPGLTAWLAGHGYAPGSRRLLMILPRPSLPSKGDAAGGDVRVAMAPADLDQVLALDCLVFEEPPLTEDQRLAEWTRITEGPRRLVLVPGDDGVARSAGLITRHSGWALLSGGETHPAFRRRGLYGAVVERRLELAESWGVDFVATHATPGTSEPILRRRGFLPLAETTVYRPRRAAAPSEGPPQSLPQP